MLRRQVLVYVGVAMLAFIMVGCTLRPAPPPITPPPPPTVDCNCWENSDCPSAQPVCDHMVYCENVGEGDGYCVLAFTDPLPDPGEVQGPEVWGYQSAKVLFQIAFDAYENPIRSGGGSANEEAWAQVEKQAPGERAATTVRYLTNNALKITLGSDFGLADPAGESYDIGSIQVVKDETAMLALLHATRDAFLFSLEQQDPAAVKEPIAEFWSAYPDYQPTSSGHCYPDGEFAYPYENPLDCQVELLHDSVASLLGSDQ